MKTESLTFYCDARGCEAKHTTPLYDGPTGAYLMLVEGGWKVVRASSWKHFCPLHIEETK